jgi:hypothetical protein
MFWATGDRERTHKDVSLNGRVLDLPITRYGRILEYKAAQWPFCRASQAASFAAPGRVIRQTSSALC